VTDVAKLYLSLTA